MTKNNTYAFAKTFRKAERFLKEAYYNGEMSREELEAELDQIEYERSESAFNEYYDEAM